SSLMRTCSRIGTSSNKFSYLHFPGSPLHSMSLYSVLYTFLGGEMPSLPMTESNSDEALDENFGTAAVPLSFRLGRCQVTMSYWSLLSAMVWLFYGALAASLYGTWNAIAAIVVSTVIFAAINVFMTRLGIRHGLNSAVLTKAIFGRWGSLLTAVLVAATVLY